MDDATVDETDFGLCYHCKARQTQRECFADDTSCFYDAKAVDTAKQYWQLVGEQVVREKKRAQTLATILSSKVLEIVKFFGNTFADFPIDLDVSKDVQFDLFAMPEFVSMCALCQCFYSKQPTCHCSKCMGDDYRTHYVILMHGILAEPFQMAYIAQVLLEAYPHVFIYFPHNLAGKSLVGLDLLLHMFSNEMLALFAKVPHKIKLSVIGHSFGGVILRYWLLFYHLKTPGVYTEITKIPFDAARENHNPRGSNEFFDAVEPRPGPDIEWCNYISMATPHSGIYENHAAFRKLISFMGSKSIDQLDNETVDLLLLVSCEAKESLKKFQKVVVYGNLSGDALVAPRTSILLPHHVINSKMVQHFLKVAELAPGQPLSVGDLMINFDSRESSGATTPTSESECIILEGKEVKMAKLVRLFLAVTAKKIKKTTHIVKLLSKPIDLQNAGDEQVCLQVFTQKDIDYFTMIISQIANRSSGSLTRKLYTNPKLLYNEVMLAGLWDVTPHKYAVYIPSICMPHKSIIALGELNSWHKYTNNVLCHMTHMFVT